MTDGTDRYFQTEHLATNLKGRIVRGGLAVILTRATSMLLGFVNMFVLMRLLSPEDFGVVDMAATLTAFLAVGGNLGLQAATVQAKEVTRERISTLFWLNATFGLLLWGLCAATGPIIAWFYGDPNVTPVAVLLGMMFFWRGVGAQPRALLHRNMRFVRFGAAELAGQVAGIAVAAAMALGGMRYWAIAAGMVVVAAVNALASIILCGFRPMLPRRGTGVRPMLRMGGWLVGFQFTTYFHRTFDKIITGRFLGGESLGYYARAHKLYVLPLFTINAVFGKLFLPILSRLQNDRRRLPDAFAGLLGVILLTSSTLAAWIAVLAEEVLLLFGPQWLPATWPLRVLSVAGTVRPLMTAASLVLMATGRTRTMFLWGVCAVPPYAVGLLIGIRGGIEGMALAYAVVTGLLTAPALILIATRAVSAKVIPVLKANLMPAVLLVLSSSSVYAAKVIGCRMSMGSASRLLFAVAAGVAVHCLLTRLLLWGRIRMWFKSIGNLKTANGEPEERIWLRGKSS